MGRGLPTVHATPKRARGRVSRGSRRVGNRVNSHNAAAVTSHPFSGTDRVLLNPPHGRTHSVIAPRSPDIAPGTPRRSGVHHHLGDHHVAHPKVLNFGHDFGRGNHVAGIAIVYVPYGYTRYVRGYDYIKDADEPEEDLPSVIRMESDQSLPPPASPKIFEVRPSELREEIEGSRVPGSDRPREERAPAPSKQEPPLFLIALKDGTIYTSTDHWLQGNTLLHYITHSGAHNLISIEEVDMSLTARLNRERGLSFVIEVREAEP